MKVADLIEHGIKWNGQGVDDICSFVNWIKVTKMLSKAQENIDNKGGM